MSRVANVINALTLIFCLTSCTGSNASTAPTGGTTLPSKISLQSVPMILDPSQVPPDPGPDNDKTVSGIDSNNNGIRDDVERWIAHAYPTSAKMRAAASQVALNTQKQITTEGLTGESAYQLGLTDVSAVSCLVDNSGETGTPDNLENILALQLNTRSRANAFISFENTMGSRAFKMPKGNTCDVSPSQLPN